MYKRPDLLGKVFSTVGALLWIGCVVGLLQGCASPADPDKMVPTDAVVKRSHSGTVDLAVTGGGETSPLIPNVSGQDFRKAIETSLIRYGIFSRVIQKYGADYRLDVELRQLQPPDAGYNFTVTSKAHWELTNMKTGNVIWRDDIERRFTATVGNALYGTHRLELANEGAIRENIKAAVQELGQLSF